MWNYAEAVALLDKQGRVCVISRNEDESPIQHVVGKRVADLLCEDSRQDFDSAFGQALQGAENNAVISAIDDNGHVVCVRARFMPSPVAETPVLFHFRRFPRGWQYLSLREREVIHTLHESGMNPKRTARRSSSGRRSGRRSMVHSQADAFTSTASRATPRRRASWTMVEGL